MIQVKNSKMKAVLVSIMLHKDKKEEVDLSLSELQQLAETVEIEVIGKYVQNRDSIHTATFAGSGFLKEIMEKHEDIDVLIFDNELSASQNRAISELCEVDIIDRTEVILTIFQRHAQTNEAKLQVQLAELKYQLPRLKKLWSHLDKERGSAKMAGGAASRGMGEKQIEIDKRKIRLEIHKIERGLNQIMKHKITQRKNRQDVKKVCLVGYTNVGKSTLFNALTEADVFVKDQLFATLDSTSRAFQLEKGKDIVLSDTVGFISHLPHHLIASFRATLQEVEFSDLLLHIVDISSPVWELQLKEVEHVLIQIGCAEIQRLTVFNKFDIADKFEVKKARINYPDSIFVSAKTGENLENLTSTVDLVLNRSAIYDLFIPHNCQKVINRVFELGNIITKEYEADGLQIKVELNREDVWEFDEFVLEK